MNKITITAAQGDIRLDRFIKKRYDCITQGLIERLLRSKSITVNGVRAKSNQRIYKGDELYLPNSVIENKKSDVPYAPPAQKITSERVERLIYSNVIYIDTQIIALNKPAGLAVQGGSGVKISVDSLLPYLMPDKLPRNLRRQGKIADNEYPRLVHRIDKDTSGVLLIARTEAVSRILGEKFKQKEMEKEYLAIVAGVPVPRRGAVKAPILAKARIGGHERSIIDEERGKYALTNYEVIDTASKTLALVRLYPETGRTHQLRVHMNELNCPILSDGKYGGSGCFINGVNGKMHLHANNIRFNMGKQQYDISAELPEHMQDTIKMFNLELG